MIERLENILFDLSEANNKKDYSDIGDICHELANLINDFRDQEGN